MPNAKTKTTDKDKEPLVPAKDIPENLARLLLKITNAVSLANNLDEAFEKLVSITTSKLKADRGTIFLNDAQSGELYSRVAQGHFRREIRIMNNSGVAGWVFQNDESAIIKSAYKDKRFNKEIDERSGYKTETILCSPLKNLRGETIGVAQILNKKEGFFSKRDLVLLNAITEQASMALERHLIVEQTQAARAQELQFLNVVAKIAEEVKLAPLLQKIITTITDMLDAERATLFINDEKTNELYTEVAMGLGSNRIRLPNHLGIAGAVFQTRESINIPYAYADLRFNPSFDKKTGFFTRSILCTPVFNKAGKVIGVTQVLNKHGGNFTEEDEARLKAFTSQIAIGIENATLFDNLEMMQSYTQSILESMTSGVLTINSEGKIATINKAASRIMKTSRKLILEHDAKEFLSGPNQWVTDKIIALEEALKTLDEMDDDDEDKPIVENEFLDTEVEFSGETVSVNLTIKPLVDVDEKRIGTLLLMEDISNEKRMKSTMSRYMNPDLAAQLLEEGEDMLGGKESIGTVLFSDIRSFTTLTESLGAQGTVSLLNDYFTFMVDCIQEEGGMLDKFIGDACMAIFGTPIAHDDDPDRGVRSAIKMMTSLNEFNMRRKQQGMAPIDHGMGLNTDTIVSGNIGSPKRMDYTVIGDGVNLAARVESSCKQYGAHILISEYTYKALKATYRTRQVDCVIVKGKTVPVKVYEVLDYHTKESFPNMVEALEMFNNGIDFYNEARWDDAIKQFEKAKKINPNDKAVNLYVERCNILKAKNPKDWDGVWVATSK